MTRLLLINFMICAFLGYFSYVSSFPNAEKIAALKEMIDCSHKKCEEENRAHKALFKDELNKCLTKCNAAAMDFFKSEPTERMKLRECFKQNGCKQPYEHMKQHQNTPEFKKLNECAKSKCKELYDKVPVLENTFNSLRKS